MTTSKQRTSKATRRRYDPQLAAEMRRDKGARGSWGQSPRMKKARTRRPQAARPPSAGLGDTMAKPSPKHFSSLLLK